DLLLVKKSGGWRMKDFFVYAPLPVILALYMLIKQQLAGYSTLFSMPMSRLTYFMTELKVFLVYLRVIFLPTGQNADYALLPDPGLGLVKLVSVAIMAGAVYLAWKFRKAYPVQVFFGLWFLCVLAPESTIFPITDVAVEYRLYLGLAGLSALAVIALHGMVASPRFRMAAAVSVLALFAILTLNRNTVWADFYTFWNDVAKKSPYSARAEENLGVSLAMAGNYQDALGHFGKSLKLNPAPEQLDKIYNNLAIIYYRQGMTEMAMQYFQKAAENNPDRPEGYTNLANLYIEQGMYSQAVETLRKAVKVNPNFAETYLKLTEAYSRMGNTAEAVEAAGNALRCAPMSSTAYHNMAMMDRMAGRIPDAIQYEQKAIDLAANSQELSQAEQGMNMLRGGR
ncbi:MAG TPA: tetratricopeptide repeat protein, partial [Nitrospirota bacterium]